MERYIGIEEVEQFRDRVLQQRDKIRKTVQSEGQFEDQKTSIALPVQDEILATLKRIEMLLQK